MSEASITIGNTLTVGKVILNPKDIQGVGGKDVYYPYPITIYGKP